MQAMLDSPDRASHGDTTDTSQVGDPVIHDAYAGTEWLKWTELMPEEETIANCWTEIIDVEQGHERVSMQEFREMAFSSTFVTHWLGESQRARVEGEGRGGKWSVGYACPL